jgi:beta-xylosidase
MYGTRAKTCWTKADGFDCYVSENLENWSDAIEIFSKPKTFFADQNYWAPECYYHDKFFYLLTTFGCETKKKGIYVLRSTKPTGPFEIYSNDLTPENWSCIDGTFYFSKDKNCLIFSRSFEDNTIGEMYMTEVNQINS